MTVDTINCCLHCYDPIVLQVFVTCFGVDGWVDEWVGGWVGGWMDGWVDGWVGGWVDGWVDGWMGEWMERLVQIQSSSLLLTSLYIGISSSSKWQHRFDFTV